MNPILIIGLGNPGPEYKGNRHNAGFMSIDRIMSDYEFEKPSLKFGGSISEGVINDQKVFCFKPLSYMNTSGIPTREVCNFYKIPPENVIVIHDELDLPFGEIRTKIGGGNAGHNGLKSLDAHIGKNYQRIRIGIGHPGDKDLVLGHVLSDFSEEEQSRLDLMIGDISKRCKSLLILIVEGK